MVREGLAFVYTVPGEWPELARALLAAQNEALDAGRGFWPRILALPQAGRPWVGNARSLRAFPEGSPEAGSLARRNRVPLANLEAVFRQGFCPARQVSPGRRSRAAPAFPLHRLLTLRPPDSLTAEASEKTTPHAPRQWSGCAAVPATRRAVYLRAQ
jgi:hypothetical protein